MNYELRTLDPARDEKLFKQSYEWLFVKPEWFQYVDGVASVVSNTYSFENYLASAMKATEYNVGLFNGKLQAVYVIQDQGDGSMQVHVNAERGANRDALVAGADCLKRWLFEHGATEIFGWLASINRPMRRFAEQAGFRYCGVSVFKGGLNDRPIRWLRFQAVK
jgi:RimJ/RimL family protein N-acetyltransferase